MADLEPSELFKIRLIGLVFAVVHFTTHHNFLGASIFGWLKWGLLILTFFAWITRQPPYLTILSFSAFVAVQFIYWYVKRQGYIRFIPIKDKHQDIGGEILADNKKIKTLATGTFSVSTHEAYVLQKPAEYWRVPIGDHAIMVQHSPGKFLYQFIQAGTLQSIQAGFLIFGRRPQETLAITFVTSWGPEFAENTPKQFMSSANHTPARLQRTIYLSFETAETRHRVRQNLLRDVGKPLHKPI